MRHAIACAALLAGALWTGTPARAGVFADDMGRCLVGSTTAKDKTDLVRWIFAMAALHPDVQGIAAMTAPQREDFSRETGQLIERLLTVSCRQQTQDALRHEGPVAIQLAFQVLGQVAMQALMSHPTVNAGFSGISRYIDESKIRALSPRAN